MSDNDESIISPWEDDDEATPSTDSSKGDEEQSLGASTENGHSTDPNIPPETSCSNSSVELGSPSSSPAQSSKGLKFATASLSIAVVCVGLFATIQHKNADEEINRLQSESISLRSENYSLESKISGLERDASNAEDDQNSLTSENSNLRTALNGFNPCGLSGYGTPTQSDQQITYNDGIHYAGTGCEYPSDDIKITVGSGTLKQKNVVTQFEDGGWFKYYDTTGLVIVISDAETSESNASREINKIKSQLDKDRDS